MVSPITENIDIRTFLKNFSSNPDKAIQIPSRYTLYTLTRKSISVLTKTDLSYKPNDINGHSGAMLDFSTSLPTIIVPDFHARIDFLVEILNFCPPEGFLDADCKSVLEALEQKKIRVICLGDGLHSENRGRDRWNSAYQDYMDGNITGKAMTNEMAEGLSLMCLVMKCLIEFPGYFNFLKGNHENILNKNSGGDFSFRKFVLEGSMTTSFMLKKYGLIITHRYAQFEDSLPLFVRSPLFLASHAEPVQSFSLSELINARNNPFIVQSLIWTKNGEADIQAVSNTLKALLPDYPDAVYFGGHRPVPEGLYTTRCEGKYIQIHNPEKHEIALVKSDRPFNPDTDIYEVEETNG